MMRTPTVSVLIPCFNAARWLHAAVSSALAADGVHEVIVVDDGSSDESSAIARAFGSQIRFIEQSNRGGNSARNTLLHAARGEWLQFLDADDHLEPEKISRQLDEAGDLSSADVLYSPVWIETWSGEDVTARTTSAMDPDADLFAQWIAWHLPQTGGALWRRAKLLEIGGWDEAMPCCQEHELYLRALQAGARFRYCPSPGAVYRIWSSATVCHRDPSQVVAQRTRLIDRALEYLAKTGRLQPHHVRIAAQACFEMARRLAGFDLAQAEAYYRDRRKRDLILVRGGAAPLPYRLAHGLIGFRRAEQLAVRLRRPSSLAA